MSPDASLGGLPSARETASSPKIAALYKLTDSFGLFGSLARTERLPSLDEVYSAWYPDYPADMTPAYGLDLGKERAFSREVGFTLSGDGLIANDDSVALKTTFFRNDIRDLIQRLDIGPNSGFENVGRARIEGLEIELSYDAESIFAQADYALVRGYDLTSGGYLNTVAPDEFSFTLGGRLVDRGLSFGWRGRLVEAQERVATGSTARLPTPGFDVHNIFLSWTPTEGAFKGLSANLAVDNIFNRHYREYLANDYTFGRTFKISFTQSF